MKGLDSLIEPGGMSMCGFSAIDPGQDAAEEANVGTEFQTFPTDAYMATTDFDWDSWNESFSEDVLYGFMGSQMHTFGDVMPDIMGLATEMPQTAEGEQNETLVL